MTVAPIVERETGKVVGVLYGAIGESDVYGSAIAAPSKGALHPASLIPQLPVNLFPLRY